MNIKQTLLALVVALFTVGLAAPAFACGGPKTADKHDDDTTTVAQEDGDEDDSQATSTEQSTEDSKS